MSKAQEDEELDLARALGASAPSSVQVLTLYVPSKDRLDLDLPDQRKWVMEAAEILAHSGGGVTILPPVEGGGSQRTARSSGSAPWCSTPTCGSSS